MEVQDSNFLNLLLCVQSFIERSEHALDGVCRVGDDTVNCILLPDSWNNVNLSRVDRLTLLRMIVRLEQLQVAYTNVLEYFHYKLHKNA